MKLFDAVLDLLFPPKCPFCGKLVDKEGLCPKCEKELPWTAGKDVVRRESGGLCCAAPLWYAGLAREGILRFKFHGAASARVFGELIARCAAEELSGQFDTVTWVPVGKKRLKERGFDQARLLAQAACRLWDTKPERLLVKPVDTPRQSGITGEAARRANVLGVYELARGVDVKGRRILLIDDVCTSGATLKECVRILLDAGAGSVVCAALAHTPKQGAGRESGKEDHK